MTLWKLQRPFWPNEIWWESSFGQVSEMSVAWGTGVHLQPTKCLTYCVQHKKWAGLLWRWHALQCSLGTSGYRFQPYGGDCDGGNYNQDRIARTLGTTRFWLVGSRIDVTMTNTLFSYPPFIPISWADRNINLNARFHGVFKPASDLFLVIHG